MGSATKNLQIDPNKQKIVDCIACTSQIVVGKFTKKEQKCDKCKDIPKGKASADKKKSEIRRIEEQKPTFGAELVKLTAELGFEVDRNRNFKKKYPIDGGGVATIYIHIDSGITGKGQTIEYFSLITQRAVSVNEDFRKFMPPEASSDCEVITAEFGGRQTISHDIGYNKCDNCGEMTNEYGVDPSAGKILCMTPNKCFMKKFSNAGAESEE